VQIGLKLGKHCRPTYGDNDGVSLDRVARLIARADVTFIQGRSKETRLALLKDINARVAAADVSPDDMLITLYEVPGENISFGQGEAQRANAVART
jgi:hypothetical protein